MRTELFWIPTPTPGQLAVMPRPRGGDWLEDEVRAWRSAGVDVIVSLLTPEEIDGFDLSQEERLGQANALQFIAFPIPDRGVPVSTSAWLNVIDTIANHLSNGKNVAIHCRQGIGRAPLVALGVLVHDGVALETAIRTVSEARGCPVPETSLQREWLERFAKNLVSSPAK